MNRTNTHSRQLVELLPRVVNALEHASNRIEPAWRDKTVTVRKYVDDNQEVEKLYMKNKPTLIEHGQPVKYARGVQSEAMFRHISTRAEKQGLLVNTKKTAVLAISGARSYKANVYIGDHQGNRIESQDKLKTLGFVFNSRGDVADQVELLKNKFRSRLWTLRELRRHEFSEAELLKVYSTMIRPVVEYSAVIYHSMLSAEQTNELEKLQASALKNIYGHVYSYNRLLQLSGIQTLAERRRIACLKFATKTAANPRFSSWFPMRRTSRRRGNILEYAEKNARTDRRMNSPLYFYRRILNDRVNYDVRRTTTNKDSA